MVFVFRSKMHETTNDDRNELTNSGAIYKAFVPEDYYDEYVEARYAMDTPKPGQSRLVPFMDFPLSSGKMLYANRKQLVWARCLWEPSVNLLDPKTAEQVNADAAPSECPLRICVANELGETEIIAVAVLEEEIHVLNVMGFFPFLTSDAEYLQDAVIYFNNEDADGMLVPLRNVVWVEMDASLILQTGNSLSEETAGYYVDHPEFLKKVLPHNEEDENL